MKRAALGIVMVGSMLGACSSGHTTAIPGPTTTVAGPTVTVTATKTVTATAQCLTADQAARIVSRDRGGKITIVSRHGFACADGWAYVNFVGPNSPNEATVDLQYVDSRWIVGDREVACGDGTAPPAMVPALVHGGCGN